MNAYQFSDDDEDFDTEAGYDKFMDDPGFGDGI